MDSISLKEKRYQFKLPQVENELGEVERISVSYGGNTAEQFMERFLAKAKETELSTLFESDWRQLENTDSFDIPLGGWDRVNEHVTYVNQTTGANRKWQTIKAKIENNEELDAPIILKYEGVLHLVSGNTRLMVARALGVTPQVLIVEL